MLNSRKIREYNRINITVVSILLTLLMIVSSIPAVIFADEQLENYDIASYSEVEQGTGLYRIGQNGTTNVRMYFFHGSEAENENGGIPNGEHVYANSYNFNYTILTQKTADENWDNYIQNPLDSTEDIEFGVFFSGTQAAWLGDRSTVEDYVLNKLSLQTEDGTILKQGKALYSNLVVHAESIKEPGDYQNVGPARSSDVLFSIPAGSLDIGADYKLVFESGMGTERGPLDATIVFHFTTQATQATKIWLDRSEAVITEGTTLKLTASVSPEDADRKVKWTTSDDMIADVDENGNVRAVSPGKAAITAATTNGLTASCRITVVPSDVVEQRVIEIEEGINQIPERLLDTPYNTETRIAARLRQAISEEGGFTAGSNNTLIFDVKLMLSTDGGENWREALPEDFSDEGVTVTLPYPEGTSSDTHDFAVAHMFTSEINGRKPGDTELPELLETDEGLVMTVDSLSPFALSWTGAGNSSDADGAVQTGDEMNIAIYAIIMVLAGTAAAAVFVFRRRYR